MTLNTPTVPDSGAELTDSRARAMSPAYNLAAALYAPDSQPLLFDSSGKPLVLDPANWGLLYASPLTDDGKLAFVFHEMENATEHSWKECRVTPTAVLFKAGKMIVCWALDVYTPADDIADLVDVLGMGVDDLLPIPPAGNWLLPHCDPAIRYNVDQLRDAWFGGDDGPDDDDGGVGGDGSEGQKASFKKILSAFNIDTALADGGFRAAHPFPVAVRLAMRDYRMLPVAVRTKIPLVKGWTERATTDPAKLAAWQRRFTPNWSILTGRENNVVVLDVDGEQGRADLARLESELGLLPITWRCASGRVNGGFHVWLRPPPGDDDLRNQQPLPGTKIDVRGHHGHVVVAGSLHNSGNRYAWAPGCSPDDIELAECPQAWWEWLPKKGEVVTTLHRRAPSVRPGPLVKEAHDADSCLIGDGPGYGGFNRPVRIRCCQFWACSGTDARAGEFVEVLRATILSADASNHTPEQIARYASKEYLAAELASARQWINAQAENKSKTSV